MNTLRILIADDHTLFRFGLRALLAPEDDLDVIGEATTGDEVVRLAAELHPDVILMDLNMPGCNGIEATRRILKSSPEFKILVLTMFDDDSVFAALRAGAHGYILKGASGVETLRSIRAVADGEAIFSPAIARRLQQHFAGSPEAAQAFPQLTEREREILSLVAQGLNNAAIAGRVYLSPKTVRNMVSTIFSKLQVADRAEAIVRAREAGMGRDDR